METKNNQSSTVNPPRGAGEAEAHNLQIKIAKFLKKSDFDSRTLPHITITIEEAARYVAAHEQHSAEAVLEARIDEAKEILEVAFENLGPEVYFAKERLKGHIAELSLAQQRGETE